MVEIIGLIRRSLLDILKETPISYNDKVRLIFVDDSYMDIRYPIEGKYSFHWQRGNEIFRIDTAPHHHQLSTYPRHIHMRKEECVVEDTLTEIDNTIDENVKSVLRFVRKKLEKKL